jgi:CRISPR/Cas system CMR-associated protein Cmr5 small subunit
VVLKGVFNMWRVIHIDKNGENVFLETDNEYLARDTYKSAKSAVKIKFKGGLGLLGARLECDPDLTGEYEVVDEISVDVFKESKFSVKESLYKTEFPDYDGILYCPDGFKDVSYHNDTMPHVRKEMQVNGRDVEINIWQDYKDVDKREYDHTDRFAFQLVVDGEIIEEHTTNDLSEIKKYVADLDKIVDKALSESIDIKQVTNKILDGSSLTEAINDVVK